MSFGYDLGLAASDRDYYVSLLSDTARPMFNRAFNGSFTPGSVFKPMVAAAALQEGTITPSTSVVCTGVYDFDRTYRPKCLGQHGSVSLNQAITKSCNVYFYEVGRLLGIENIDAYAKEFGLGQKTGIELSESAGSLASPEARADAGGIWYPGDVIQAAIGQSDNTFTPLQLATYCATIANNGTRLQTHLIRKITNYNQDEVISEKNPDSPVVVEQVPVSQENLKLVQAGMRSVCSTEGTGRTFANYGVAIAAKTGTAEIPGHSDNVTFIGYAPYDKPEIAVAVVLEYGSRGTYSMAVARDIFDAYFFGTSSSSEIPPGFADAREGLDLGTQALGGANAAH